MKELYVCWMDDDGVEDPGKLEVDSPHCIMDYCGEEAASVYAEKMYHDSSGEVGESFQINVLEKSSGTRARFAVEVEYSADFHVCEIDVEEQAPQ